MERELQAYHWNDEKSDEEPEASVDMEEEDAREDDRALGLSEVRKEAVPLSIDPKPSDSPARTIANAGPRKRGRKKGSKNKAKGAAKLIDALSHGDPADVSPQAGSVRNRRTRSGRQSLTPDMLSYNWKGMDARMVQHSTGVNY